MTAVLPAANRAPVPDHIHQHRWPARDSLAPAGAPVRGVYLFHGLGEHGGCYEHVAHWFAERGFRAGAHDHPGHGRSGGQRGRLSHKHGFEQAAIDHYRQFAAEFDQPPLLIGHSLGGALAAKLVLTGVLKPGGLILSAPAFRPAMSQWQLAQLRIMNALASNVVVSAQIRGHLLTHDEAMQHARSSDELIHRSISARLLNWLVATGAQALALAPELTVRTLVLNPLDDVIVEPQGSEAFAASAPPAMIRYHHYSGLYHEIFNESPDDRARVFADIDRWLDAWPA